MKKQVKIMKYISLVLAAAFLFASCEKEGKSPDSTAKKIRKIQYDGGSYESIDYNSNGTIHTITNHTEYTAGQPADHVVFTFAYNNNLVTEMQGSDGVTFKFSYDGKKVVKTEISSGGTLVGVYQYSYSNDRVSQVDAFIRIPGTNLPTTPTMRYVNEYYASGNLKKTSIFTPSGANLKKVDEVVIDDYDSKFNPIALFENNPFLPLENFLPNNPLKETHFNQDGVIVETVVHTYTYDANGNPLTRKSVSKAVGSAEQTENATFTY